MSRFRYVFNVVFTYLGFLILWILNFSALFIFLETQRNLCESLVYIFVPKLFQLYIYVFQTGNKNGNDCGLLKQNGQIVATLLYPRPLLSMQFSYTEVYFFVCFIKSVIQVRLDFAKFSYSVGQWFSHKRGWLECWNNSEISLA